MSIFPETHLHNTDLLTLVWFCLVSFPDRLTLFIWQRATGVLSTVLPQSSEAIQRAIQENVVRTMHRLLKVCNCVHSKHGSAVNTKWNPIV